MRGTEHRHRRRREERKRCIKKEFYIVMRIEDE